MAACFTTGSSLSAAERLGVTAARGRAGSLRRHPFGPKRNLGLVCGTLSSCNHESSVSCTHDRWSAVCARPSIHWFPGRARSPERIRPTAPAPRSSKVFDLACCRHCLRGVPDGSLYGNELGTGTTMRAALAIRRAACFRFSPDSSEGNGTRRACDGSGTGSLTTPWSFARGTRASTSARPID